MCTHLFEVRQHCAFWFFGKVPLWLYLRVCAHRHTIRSNHSKSIIVCQATLTQVSIQHLVECRRGDLLQSEKPMFTDAERDTSLLQT